MKLQQQIDEILKEKGISRYQLSKDTGINESQISRFFREKVNLSLENILMIVEYLECDLQLVPKNK